MTIDNNNKDKYLATISNGADGFLHFFLKDLFKKRFLKAFQYNFEFKWT